MARKRMSLLERMEIFKGFYALKMKHIEISKKLNRAPSSITREIKPKLELKWSPEQISDYLKESSIGTVSSKTI